MGGSSELRQSGPVAKSTESGSPDLQPLFNLEVEGDFEALYRKYSPGLLRYAHRCVGRPDVAEEITSEAFLRLYRERRRIDSRRLPGWLFTAVKNLATSFWRRSMTEQKYASQPSPVPDSVAPDAAVSILGARQLKPIHRTCLILRYVHGFVRSEIGARLGLTDNEVKNCLQYGLQLLRKHFDQGDK
jgi:RNA polymerase sigma-70 factor (ECF subfamily)